MKIGDSLGSRLKTASLAVAGIIAFVAVALILDDRVGVPFDLTYRIACAAICLFMMGKVGADYPGQRWPWIAVTLVLLTNTGLFFTPVFDRPASRGELLLFAFPDVVIFLTVRAYSYPVSDVHQRAVRQQLIVGAMLALAVCAMLLATTFIPDHTTH